ncbi:tudor and KH domain-containing protein homolog [Chelonus insularis]|uniref:tudor and KH domain-containing protein homolog n=1 Tax=Chelonus insularis TaxID=460826 RepID=UPI0015897123|nr:tudor and KH domain-containing protein homolog [Chelonus insularis]XP_034945746.1 tudor and KH domain-containing protein homolog [Chelonus insularis]
MKLISNHIVLPIVLGISLTGVCVGLFYFLYKKKDEEENKKPISLREVKNVTYEIKILRQFVPAVIGRGGATIKDIEERTSTRIRFDKDDSECPERICRIKGTVEAIKLAEVMIQNLIADMPIIETYEMFISSTTISKLLEQKGMLVNTIQSETNTKIILEKKYYNSTDEPRRIIIKGTAEHIAEAVSTLEDLDRETKSAIEQLKLARSTRSPRSKNLPRDTANTKTPKNSPKQLESSAIAQEGVMEVYVSAVESPSRFWVQVVGEGTLALDSLVENMTAYYNNEDNREIHILKDISVGQMVAAKFSFDNCWYRAEVITLMENGLYEVYFVDYGDNEFVDENNILELRTDFLSLRLQAIECCLANVKPKDDEWSQEACNRFDVLTWAAQWKVLTAKVCGYKERVLGQGKSRREGSPIPCMELFDKSNDNQEINIGKQLIVDTFAIAEEGTWSASSSTLSLSKHDFPTSTAVAQDSTPNASISSISSVEVSPQQDKKPTNELIDLTTPIKTKKSKVIEEIDLVTPRHEQTVEFINAEKKSDSHENGDKIPVFDPSVIDSDNSADSDEFELG